MDAGGVRKFIFVEESATLRENRPGIFNENCVGSFYTVTYYEFFLITCIISYGYADVDPCLQKIVSENLTNR